MTSALTGYKKARRLHLVPDIPVNMPTTRRQTAISEGKIHPEEQKKKAAAAHKKGRGRKSSKTEEHPKEEVVKQNVEEKKEEKKEEEAQSGEKRAAEQAADDQETSKDEPPAKKTKAEPEVGAENGSEPQSRYKTGTIERGHIYFFYRPKVEHEGAHSLDDVKNFHMLLVPRSAEFLAEQPGAEKPEPSEDSEMKVLEPGADAVPAPPQTTTKKHYRLITIGKKKLPDPEGSGATSRRKETFWATVTAVGDDLVSLEKGLEAKSYQTKTRGERHQEAARPVARGAYAIVNAPAEMPSKRETHFGYRVSHPPPSEFGDVQKSLGIYPASSFILQVKNPLAPATGPQQIRSKGAKYPESLMRDVFGTAEGGEDKPARGRESYGLRFASCETVELLDYEGAELLFIAARAGEEGLEQSLGEGRGKALSLIEDKEAHESVQEVFKELGLDTEKFPAEPLEGSWI